MYFWSGKSAIDGKPIVLVFTGIKVKSSNTKTGNMIQTWILARDEAPLSALKSGGDASICGTCPRRPLLAKGNGMAPCYVNVSRAPTAIWKAYKRGVYKPLPEDYASLTKIFSGRLLRLGAYGDPSAVPWTVWASVLQAGVIGHTGYTHEWREAYAQHMKTWTMASADTLEDEVEAQAMGWRTFRVVEPQDLGALLDKQVICPASKEAGNRLTCATCLACSGTGFGRSSVRINAH